MVGICEEHQIGPAQYDPWRNQFLANVSKACEVHEHTRGKPAHTRESDVKEAHWRTHAGTRGCGLMEQSGDFLGCWTRKRSH